MHVGVGYFGDAAALRLATLPSKPDKLIDPPSWTLACWCTVWSEEMFMAANSLWNQSPI